MKRLLYLLFAFSASSALAQQTSIGDAAYYPAPVNFTAEQDHQHMMKQLGIKALRAWDASRGLDYLETNPMVDAKRVGIKEYPGLGKQP